MNARALWWALVRVVESATRREWHLSRSTSRAVLGVSLVMLASVVTACGDQAVGPAIGAVQASVATTGVELDTNGYSVAIDGGVGRAIPVNGTMTFTGLSAGPHNVLLAGLASNCGAAGAANPRPVKVVAGDTAHVAFAVTCVATTGSLVVTVSTTGTGLGSGGYSLSVDGAAGKTLPVNGAATITGLSAGSHSVSVGGFAPNCTASPPSPIAVTITAAVSTRLDVAVTCVQPPRTGRIAFISDTFCDTVADPNCVGDVYDVYVVNADGSNPLRLTTTSLGPYASPVWSPNGTQVASGAYIMNADGSNASWLPGNGTDLAWSPDGARIAFRSFGQIYVMNADGTNPTPLTTNGGFSPAWSPDGARIAFSNAGHILLMNADGSNVTALTDTSHVVGAGGPMWSPDGAKIAFQTYGQIYVMNADGTSLIRLYSGSFVGRPIWSPDGTKLVFNYSSNQIDVVNVDGTNLIRLGISEPLGFEVPAWSPDGTKILVSAYLESGFVYVVNADGSNLHMLGGAFGRATWSPDGTAIAVGASAGGSPRISIINRDGTGLAGVCNCPPYADMTYNPAWSPVRPATPAAAVNRSKGR